MPNNLSKDEGFRYFKNYFNKDIECNTTLTIEGQEHLLRGYKVVDANSIDENGNKKQIKHLKEEEFYSLYEGWLQDGGLESINTD